MSKTFSGPDLRSFTGVVRSGSDERLGSLLVHRGLDERLGSRMDVAMSNVCSLSTFDDILWYRMVVSLSSTA